MVRAAPVRQVMVVPDPATPADWNQPQDIRTFQARPQATPAPIAPAPQTLDAQRLAPMSIDEVIAGQGLY